MHAKYHLCSNLRKLKHIVIIFAKQHQESNVKLKVQGKSTSTNQWFSAANNLPCKRKRSEPLHNTKIDKLAHNQICLLAHIVLELSKQKQLI